ncbi:MAG: hypothetical protein U0694_11340 [Anaerolineae bacterium]
MYLKRIALMVTCMLLMAACNLGATGDTANDSAAAQRFLPTVTGYTASNATSISSALSTIGGGASALTGNPALTVAIAQIDSMIQCYQNVGAVAAQVYTPTVYDVTSGQIPGIGAVAVINEDRLRDNFLACVVNNQGQSRLSAQAVEPCFSSGTFTAEGDTFYYVYAGTADDLCTAFEQNFAR